jgi:ureidoacrylate peracid hydrolase
MNRREFVGTGLAAGAAVWVHSEPAAAEPNAGNSIVSEKRLVVLNAKPRPLELDLNKTAILVVDMQNDFCSKSGLMDRQGVNLAIIQRVVAPIGTVLAHARKARLKIIYLKMGFKPDLSDIGQPWSVNRINNGEVGAPVTGPKGEQGRLLIRDTWNTEIIPELKPAPGDLVFFKNRFNGFHETALDGTLKRSGIQSLIVVGCTTSVCVESTIRGASFLDYAPVVLSDCTAEPIGYDLPRSNHEATLYIIENLFGWVATSDQLIKALSDSPGSNAHQDS